MCLYVAPTYSYLVIWKHVLPWERVEMLEYQRSMCIVSANMDHSQSEHLTINKCWLLTNFWWNTTEKYSDLWTQRPTLALKFIILLVSPSAKCLFSDTHLDLVTLEPKLTLLETKEMTSQHPGTSSWRICLSRREGTRIYCQLEMCGKDSPVS